jgi:hypothetical protein
MMGLITSVEKMLMGKAAGFNTPRAFIDSLEKEGKLAYHGTAQGDFEKFSMAKRGTGADARIAGLGDSGKGIYLTKNPKEAQAYASGLAKEGYGNNPYVHKVFVNANKPFDMDDIGKKANFVDNTVRKQSNFFKKDLSDAEYSEIYKLAGINEKQYNLLRDIEGSVGDNWNDFDIGRTLKQEGYDSLIAPNKELVVFNSRRLKTQKQLTDLWNKAR